MAKPTINVERQRMLFCGPFALRRIIRRRRGQCPVCNYPIGQSPVCTECGAAVMPHAAT